MSKINLAANFFMLLTPALVYIDILHFFRLCTKNVTDIPTYFHSIETIVNDALLHFAIKTKIFDGVSGHYAVSL